MSNPEVLNLDEIVPPNRSVRIKGVNHPLADMSLKDYIATIRASEALVARAKAGTASNADVVETNIDAVSKLLPTVERSELEAMTDRQLIAVLAFARATAEAAAPEAKEAPTKGKATEKASRS